MVFSVGHRVRPHTIIVHKSRPADNNITNSRDVVAHDQRI